MKCTLAPEGHKCLKDKDHYGYCDLEKDFTQTGILELLFAELKEKDSSMICDCLKNYGRACKKPDKYKTGGCK